ncbi:MHYT domain-containing protein [Jeongeupia sp. USM3]|uniref:MHYT domain-containing protein n=1 Tax=Jeongeupia sp. USM3 TaxID=1906741 RepID=UPI00089E021E|nr:MHYT domain-containing protein [Jeongeupia sp. USM3]AOY00623.1 hypothetical protein BJP62_09330 [Jeongeupia sp. USM3]
MNGSYDLLLVIVSYLVAALASYTALDLAGRISASSGARSYQWLAGGSVAMGTGIWAMHFTGMMAFELPIAVTYNVGLTALSWLAAIAVSMLALRVASRDRLGYRTIAGGAMLMGIGICTMHYTGMAAMQVSPGIDYNVGLVLASALIAVSASAVALIIAFRLRELSSQQFSRPRLIAALVMGVAVVGMHYTGMAAAQFASQTVCTTASGLSGNWGGLPLAAVTAVILFGTLMLSRADAAAAVRAKEARQREEDAQRLYRLTYVDGDTGLPNRSLLKDTLSQLTTGQGAIQRRFALAVIELNGTEALLAQYGRHNETPLIVAVAKRIQRTLPQDDLLVRWGQHAFGVLSQHLVEPEALQRQLQAIFDTPLQIGDRLVALDTSIHCSVYPDDGHSPHVLIARLRHVQHHPRPEPRDAAPGYGFGQPSAP